MFAPCVVSWPRSLHRMWVAVAVVVPHVVSWLRSFVPCVSRGHGLCAACGVTVTIVALRRCCRHRLCATWVSWSRSLRRVVLQSWWLLLSCMVLQLRSSSSRRHWTTKEEVSRKKKKENVPAGQRGACGHKRVACRYNISQIYLIT